MSTKQLPPDPDQKNEDRAFWADVAIEAFREETGTDIGDALADLLCDLMHWCDRNPTDFEQALSNARFHYEAETQDPEDTEQDDA